MPPFYQRPENALKRAEELIAVNQNGSALELLHDVIMSKRSRTTPLTALEPIMLKFVELSVLLRKGKISKEGLHQYKNISQNVTISTIELVIKRFIELSEEKVAEAQAKANQINLDTVEDLEATETPESIILSTVSGEVSKDRTDREVVTPWLKFLWEAYRTALDILRNNARLEVLYQTIATQAFKFCLKYERKTEFRRLCELLRQHVTTAAKYSHQAHAINLNEPETLQRHLDTRFEQLNAAAELELWQEAFRSVEDIHNLLCVAKKPPKAFMMANYYEKLARIFMVGENYLFNAAAWSKYYSTVRSNKNYPEEEHQRMSSIVLLSSLAIPIISSSKRSMYSENDDGKPRTVRLTNLLRVAKAPNREALLKEALGRNVFSRVRPELRELYNILEVDFHPLSICKKVAPILATLSETKELAKYIKPLQELSQVYTTISMDSILSLATFSPSSTSNNFDINYIEKFVMNGCRKGELNIRIDHMTKSLMFESNIFGGSKVTISEGPKLQSMPSESVRLHLAGLGSRLYTAVNLIDPEAAKAKKEKKLEVFKIALESAEEERKLAFSRRLLIEKKKEIRENEAAKKAREEERVRALQMQQEAEEERKRMEEAQKQRESEQIELQRAAIEKEEARKLAEELANTLKTKNLKSEDLENLDSKELREKQIELLEQERKELTSKTKNLSRRIDHVERAYRKVELPLWTKDYDDQKRIDRAYYNALTAAQMEASARKHAEDVKVKNRLSKTASDYKEFKSKLDKARDQKFKAQIAESKRLIEEAKAARIEEFRRAKEEAIQAREREEQEIRAREEEARREAEEYELRKAEREAAETQRKAEEEERLMRLAEQSERQRERERLAEERIAASRRPPSAQAEQPPDNVWRPSRPTSDSAPSAWRSRQAAAQAPTPEPIATTAPPSVWRRRDTPEPPREQPIRSQTPTTPIERESETSEATASWTTVNKPTKYIPPSQRAAAAASGAGIAPPRRDGPRDEGQWGRREVPTRDGPSGPGGLSGFGDRRRDGPPPSREGGGDMWKRDGPTRGAGDREGERDPAGGNVWRRSTGPDSGAAASSGKYVPPRRQ
ncbi:eukaryotic translation initiation factor 3 subunit A [Dinochytrium kinnereticum]|nr:eukaryotic translation initiation factor 3 subunit A [Dinochytrium kinnereticum]